MVIINASGVSKAFGVDTVIREATFGIEEGEKIGIIGPNGAGKTTLFKLITGELAPDSGELHISRQTRVAYMQQHAEYTSEKTAYEEVLGVFDSLMKLELRLAELQQQMELAPTEDSIRKYNDLHERFMGEGGMTFRARSRSALLGLGLMEEELALPLSAISGGQRTRVLLARMLLSGAEVLLLDEPTNHLDIKAIAWLEGFLREYTGTVVIISHDRFFLDRVVNRVFEIDGGVLEKYKGNYTQYVEQRRLLRLTQEREYRAKTKEIARLEGIIAQQKRWNRERNLVTARSKQKAIDRIEQTLRPPAPEAEEMHFSFKAESGSGNDVLILENVAKAFEGMRLFSDVNMHILRGEKVFLLGDNGCGKTTLLRIIRRQIEADCGKITLGSRVRVGYYDQAQSDLPLGQTILDAVAESAPHVDLGEIRNALAIFLFRGDDVFKRIGDLSGGERARVALTRLMLSRCNFLLMDEPTNHLDIQSKEALEQALKGYDGTLLMISHDRYFIDKLADKIYRLTADGTELFGGNYQFYLEKSNRPERQEKSRPLEKQENDYQMKKRMASEERRRRGRISRIEAEIEAMEEKKAAKEAELALPEIAADYGKVLALSNEVGELQQNIDKLYEQWEAYSEEL